MRHHIHIFTQQTDTTCTRKTQQIPRSSPKQNHESKTKQALQESTPILHEQHNIESHSTIKVTNAPQEELKSASRHILLGPLRGSSAVSCTSDRHTHIHTYQLHPAGNPMCYNTLYNNVHSTRTALSASTLILGVGRDIEVDINHERRPRLGRPGSACKSTSSRPLANRTPPSRFILKSSAAGAPCVLTVEPDSLSVQDRAGKLGNEGYF